MPDISPHAIVEKSAKLAKDVRVGPFSYIGPQVKIGAGCVIENNVTITGKTRLGERNHVFPMAVIGTGADDGRGGCIIEKANTIREHVTIYAGGDAPTRIGTNNLIMIACTVAGSARVGDQGIFANCTHIGAGAVVEEYVRTSGFAVIQPGAAVGAYTFIAGHAIIEHHAPPFAIVQSFPYRVRGVNVENLRRCGFADEDIQALRGAFRELFNDQTDHARPAALESLPAHLARNRYVARLVAFIREHAGPPGAAGNG